MSRTRTFLILLVIVVLGAGTAWLLSGGGGTRGSSKDPKGDVVVSKGAKPPQGKALADIRNGSIKIEEGTATFEARINAVIPESLKQGAASYRWEITENGQVTWIVSANVDVQRTASVVATQHDYRGSTIDDSLPGNLLMQNERIFLTLELDAMEGFPETFEWTLETELDGDLMTSPSAVATDRMPDEGLLEVGSE